MRAHITHWCSVDKELQDERKQALPLLAPVVLIQDCLEYLDNVQQNEPVIPPHLLVYEPYTDLYLDNVDAKEPVNHDNHDKATHPTPTLIQTRTLGGHKRGKKRATENSGVESPCANQR